MFGKDSYNLEFKQLGDQRWIIEENGNQMRVLQVGMWGSKDEPIDESKCRFEVRTVFISRDGEEKMGKGCSFTEDGINELARLLVKQGKGHTKELLTSMTDREDFFPTLKQVLNGNPEAEDIDLSNIDDEYFDASSIFNTESEEYEEVS